MEYIVYKTTNLINGKIYVGVRKQSKGSEFGIDTFYLGSGPILKNSINKRGLYDESNNLNYSRETLYSFSSMEEALEKEAEIVTQEFLDSGNTYNLKLGGKGGWDYVNSVYYKTGNIDHYQQLKTPKARKKLREVLISKYGKEYSHLTNPEVRKKSEETKKKKYGLVNGMMITEEAKAVARITKRNNSIKKFPELLYHGELCNELGVPILRGSTLSILTSIYGYSHAVMLRHKLTNLENGRTFWIKGPLKGYSFHLIPYSGYSPE